jgi:hypothetical protein
MAGPKEPISTNVGAAVAQAIEQIEGQVRSALSQAHADVSAARAEENTKVLLRHLIKLHQDSFSVAEKIFQSAEIRHGETKESFQKVNANIATLREFFDADLKRVSTELSNLRGDMDKLATKEEIKTYTARIESHVEAIRAQLGTLLKHRLE